MSLKISGCDYCGTGWTGKEVPHPKLKCPERRIEDLESRLAEREKELAKYKESADKSICTYCGHIGPKTSEAMVEHMATCEKHPTMKMLKEFSALIDERDAARSMAEKLAEALRHCIDIHLKNEVIAGPRKALSLFEQMKKGTV